MITFFVRELRTDEATGETREHRPQRENPLRVLCSIARKKSFWRFVLLISLLVGVKQIYRYAARDE